ncbi:MAG: lysylphosphatidylglycerol synthase transmembrane domain-containing protein [Pseudomonadota bacterium]
MKGAALHPELADDAGAAPATGGGRNRKALALKIGVSAALIAWILSDADLAAVWASLAAVDPGWLALALASQVVGAALIAFRWGGLLALKGVAPGFPYLLGSTVSASFFRQFLPSIVGGDAIRGYDAWRAGASPGLAAVSLVVDRLLGLTALAVFALIALSLFEPLNAAVPGVRLWVALGLVCVVGALALMLIPGLRAPRPILALHAAAPSAITRRVDAVVEAVGAFRGEGGGVLRAFGLSLLIQINVVSSYWLLSQALGLGIDYADFYVIVPVAVFVMMAPITINGVGLREAIFIFLLAIWGIGEPQALAFAWLEYAVYLVFGLAGGVVYALRRGGRRG